MATSLRAYLCVLLCLAAVSESAKVTPMEKVIVLLKDLSAKVAEEGKKEAAQYDKFACFCKDQADAKLYAIEKSEEKIKGLSADIKELDADISELSSDISDLSKKISKLEGEIDRKTKKREKQHAEYARQAQDIQEAIDACGAAIDALKDSKGQMDGAKLTNLLQVTKAAKTPGAVALLAKISQPKFQYQSNDIIATIEDLMAEFKAQKKDLDFTEHDVNSAFEKDRLGLANEKKFAEKERDEKEAISEEKQEARQTASEDRSDETDDMNADQAFLDETTSKCEEAARAFDQRSSTRANELTTLAKATEELEKGAVPNFSANKKLVGLQLRKASAKATTFVQVSSIQGVVQRVKEHEVFQRVVDFLADATDRTGSKALAAVTARVQLAKDHFVKVRGLIKDLIAKLKDDAKAEATQKNTCDLGMSKAISKRDSANARIEQANAKITSATARKDDLEDEILSLTEQIAKLKKELNEATELRNDEKADNAKTLADAKEGSAAVGRALGLLKGFYEFAQTSKYTPPNAGRDGKNFADVAPEVATEKYSGAGEESKGIVGILEVIQSDFDRTVKQTKQDERNSKDAFDLFEKDTNKAVNKKNNRIKKATGEKGDAESDILDNEQALSDAKKLLDSALESLEELEAMCVKGEETWEERKQKREDEIEALKEALAIFEDWKN